jgi:hypothetical protein
MCYLVLIIYAHSIINFSVENINLIFNKTIFSISIKLFKFNQTN